MVEHTPTWRIVIVALLARRLILALFLVLMVSTPSSSQEELREHLAKFSKALRYVRDDYVDSVDTHDLIVAGIQGMLLRLDPHSDFLDEKTAKKMTEEHRGSFFGVGMTISVQTGWLTVVSPIEGTPAWRAGIMTGDRIVAIEGKTTKGISSDRAAELIRGPKGTTVILTILREGHAQEMDFKLTRDRIPIASLPYAFFLRPKIAYLRLTRFAKTSAQEMDEARDKLLETSPIEALILDLRGNSGGLLSAAVDVSDRFIGDDDLIVYTAGRIRMSNQKELGSGQETWPRCSLIILVDRGSASASEIVAGAVQDWDRGIILGRTTFGKGLVQNLYELSGGNALKITTARYYTPSGRSIQREYNGTRAEYYRNAGKLEEHDDRPLAYSFGGRPLRGGGGIVPDAILERPRRMHRIETEALRKGRLFEQASHLLALRADLRTAYGSFDDFAAGFSVTPEMEDSLRASLENAQIEVTDEGWAEARESLLLEFKAEIAGHIWGPQERYMILIEQDDDIREALERLDDAKRLLDPHLLPGRPDSVGPWPREHLDRSATTS